ncbi:hypothetical protein FKM82_007621 [Ascaphus truei]
MFTVERTPGRTGPGEGTETRPNRTRGGNRDQAEPDHGREPRQANGREPRQAEPDRGKAEQAKPGATETRGNRDQVQPNRDLYHPCPCSQDLPGRV